MPWIFLLGAIVTELCGTLGLRAASSSLHPWAIVLIVIAYAASFTCMTGALRQLNVGVVYSVWSAAGIAAISLAGAVIFGERLNWQAVGGLALIVIGVAVLVTSGSVRHN